MISARCGERRSTKVADAQQKAATGLISVTAFDAVHTGRPSEGRPQSGPLSFTGGKEKTPRRKPAGDVRGGSASPAPQIFRRSFSPGLHLFVPHLCTLS